VTLIVEIGIGVFIAMSILIYSQHHDNRIDIQNKNERTKREKYAREEIYRILNGIEEVVKHREHIRTTNPLGMSDANFKNEVLFMNRQVKRIIESLQFVLLLHSENLPLLFIQGIRDAVAGFDLVLNRLELLPFEECDPGDGRTRKIDRFIEELKKIISDVK